MIAQYLSAAAITSGQNSKCCTRLWWPLVNLITTGESGVIVIIMRTIKILLVLECSRVSFAVNTNPAKRVYEGDEIEPNSRPWMALYGENACSAFLINEKAHLFDDVEEGASDIMLTAAHCVIGDKYVDLFIILNEKKFNEVIENGTQYLIHVNHSDKSYPVDGDSGSPMTCFDGNTMVAQGIMSAGNLDLEEEFKEIFVTNIASHIPWILDVYDDIKENFDEDEGRWSSSYGYGNQ
uniref:Peptidase S1 domain-containing protein n=1 Tax=Romanomermis culicivorax TaxID=13658 RepID=A0A915KZI2_ROMCU